MTPEVTPEKIQVIYDDLSQMHLELDPDPLQFGPKRLNEKVASCRGHLTRCEKMFLQISQDLHWFKREHRRHQTEFDIRMQDLLANDPEVMAGRNVKDREAIASTKLFDLRDRLNDLQVSIEDLEHLMVVIKAKRTDLKDLQGRIRDQLKICQEELGLGARWGYKRASESAESTTEEPRLVQTGGTIEEFDSLLESTVLEIKTEEKESSKAVDVDSFLDAIPDFF